MAKTSVNRPHRGGRAGSVSVIGATDQQFREQVSSALEALQRENLSLRVRVTRLEKLLVVKA